MSDGLIGYDPERISQLHGRVGTVIDDLRTIRCDDPAAAAAGQAVAVAQLHLETGWMPLLERILASQAMTVPIDGMDIDETLDFLRDDGLGQLVFALIDVANEGDLGELDGNWSSQDVAAATDPRVVRDLVDQAIDAGLELTPDEADALVATVTGVATRMADSDEAWEGIDDEVGWYEDVADSFVDVAEALTDPFVDFAGDVWDRASTYGQYLYEAGGRMVNDPGQTIVDIASGTFLVEQIAAADAILIEDGELYADDVGLCGEEFECITGARPLPGAAATTFGHTVVFGDAEAPDPDIVRHEGQHVADIEDVGGLPFYASYVANFAWNAVFEVDDVLGGEPISEAREDAYHEIIWERRAEDAEHDP